MGLVHYGHLWIRLLLWFDMGNITHEYIHSHQLPYECPSNIGATPKYIVKMNSLRNITETTQNKAKQNRGDILWDLL